MAQYEHLPIYKKAMDLAVYMENVVKGFSRYHKYSTGADLRNLSREIVALIISANSKAEKVDTLLQLRDAIERLKVEIRICKEVRAFRSFNSFQHAAEGAVNIGRQVEGWIKAVRKTVTPPSVPPRKIRGGEGEL
jgi:23S rRNA-intervening sequence protein